MTARESTTPGPCCAEHAQVEEARILQRDARTKVNRQRHHRVGLPSSAAVPKANHVTSNFRHFSSLTWQVLPSAAGMERLANFHTHQKRTTSSAPKGKHGQGRRPKQQLQKHLSPPMMLHQQMSIPPCLTKQVTAFIHCNLYSNVRNSEVARDLVNSFLAFHRHGNSALPLASRNVESDCLPMFSGLQANHGLLRFRMVDVRLFPHSKMQGGPTKPKLPHYLNRRETPKLKVFATGPGRNVFYWELRVAFSLQLGLLFLMLQ